MERRSTDANGPELTCGRKGHFVSGDEFIKYGLADPQAEFEKSEALHSIGTDCGFDAPLPLRVDMEAGTIAYRFIPGLQSSRVVYLKYMTATRPNDAQLDFFRDVGAVLARIHRRLRLHALVDWTPDEVFERGFRRATGCSTSSRLADMNWVPSHCDFGFSNVNYVESRGGIRLVVIDPSANGFTTFASNLRAPVYLDLANFANCIEGLVPLRWYPRLRWSRLGDVRGAFLRGYERESGVDVDRELLSSFAYATASSYFQSKYRSRIVTSLCLRVLFNRLKGNAATRY